MSATPTDSTDPYVEHLREARSKSAVIKIKLLSLKSVVGDSLIFAFEGGDDKIIYAQWVRRVRPDLTYEPFVCNNKEQVLRLYESLSRDQSGAAKNVFFFVDRDFDDSRGRDLRPVVFMTDRYAVENYLVSSRVLDDLLKNEFPCHGEIRLRGSLSHLFENVYSQFLDAMTEFNFHIYVGRRLKADFKGHIPDSLVKFVEIEIDGIVRLNYSAAEILPYAIIPPEDHIEKLREEFDELEPRTRYRGKFAYKFFTKWLALLVADFKRGDTVMFRDVDRTRSVREAEIVMSNLASKSDLPSGLESFLFSVDKSVA